MRVEKAVNSKRQCLFSRWLSNKDEQFIAEIADLLSDTSASTASLHRFLNAKFEDFEVGLTSFKFHRNKWCSCQ